MKNQRLIFMLVTLGDKLGFLSYLWRLRGFYVLSMGFYGDPPPLLRDLSVGLKLQEMRVLIRVSSTLIRRSLLVLIR